MTTPGTDVSSVVQGETTFNRVAWHDDAEWNGAVVE